jgi:NitT/TauT family transport system ATP-binding protein
MDSVRANDLHVTYTAGKGEVKALAGLSFSIKPSETCAIIGPSGCGKSTLLYALAGLIRPTAGAISINDDILAGERPETAVILQEYGLFPWKTVYANTALGLKLRGENQQKIKHDTEAMMRLLKIWDHRNHYPAQISGGQRQRVAIARALTLSPSLLLMDEPFSSLDALTREDIQNVFLDIWRRDQLTTFIVTHSVEEAVFLGHKIMALSDRPARILKIIDKPLMGDPDLRSNPAFHKTCSELRTLLKEARNDPNAA